MAKKFKRAIIVAGMFAMVSSSSVAGAASIVGITPMPSSPSTLGNYVKDGSQPPIGNILGLGRGYQLNNLSNFVKF